MYIGNIAENRDKEQCSKYNKANLENLLLGIKHTNCSKYIFHGEGISGFSVKELMRLKELIKVTMPNSEIHIIYCVRERISYAASAYQQAVKMGLFFNEIIIVKNYVNIYKKRITNLIKVFGKRSLVIYTFEDSIKSKGGPIGYFLNFVGIQLNDKDFGNIAANKSLSDKSIEIIEFINKKLSFEEDGHYNRYRDPSDITKLEIFEGNKYQFPNHITKALALAGTKDSKWLYDNYSVDYLNVKRKKRAKILYDDKFYQDFVNIYGDLMVSTKKALYDFLEKQLNKLYKRTIIEGLHEWIHSNHGYIEKIPDIKKLSKKLEHESSEVKDYVGKLLNNKSLSENETEALRNYLNSK